jgi:hypothetical protein
MFKSSFPHRRESSVSHIPRSGQNWGIVPLCGACSIDWIPACAGMTEMIKVGGVI